MATTHEPLHLNKQSFVQWKIVEIPTTIVWIIIFFNELIEYGDGGIFKLLRWMQNLNPSKKMLYAERSLRGWTTFINTTFVKSKNMNMAVGWMFKYIFHFMEKAHEALHLVMWIFVHLKTMHITTSFIWIIIFLNGAVKYGRILELWGYVATNA
jgi:hypothetical protein